MKMLSSFYKISVTLAIIGYVFGHSSINETYLARCTRLRTYTNQYRSKFPITSTHQNGKGGKHVFLVFYVKSGNGASILLSSAINNATKERETFEIILNSKKGKASEIRSTRLEMKATYLNKKDASPDKWRPFWIHVNPAGAGSIQVGKKIGSSAFLSWKKENHHPMEINHIGFASHGNIEVNYAFQCPKNENPGYPRCITVNTTKYEYDNVFPIVDSMRDGKDIFIPFYVKGEKEAHIVLSPTSEPTKSGGKAYEIYLGGYGGDSYGIRDKRGSLSKVSFKEENILNPNEWRHFWIRVKPNGLIKVGKKLGSPAFMSWKDRIDEMEINEYSVASYDSGSLYQSDVGTVDWALECPKRKFPKEFYSQ